MIWDTYSRRQFDSNVGSMFSLLYRETVLLRKKDATSLEICYKLNFMNKALVSHISLLVQSYPGNIPAAKIYKHLIL